MLSQFLEYVMNNDERLHWYKGYGVKDVLLSEILLHTDWVTTRQTEELSAGSTHARMTRPDEQ